MKEKLRVSLMLESVLNKNKFGGRCINCSNQKCIFHSLHNNGPEAK